MSATIGLPAPSSMLVAIHVGNIDSKERTVSVLFFPEMDDPVRINGTTLSLSWETEPPNLDPKGCDFVTKGAVISD
jgi:hypothetical protein